MHTTRFADLRWAGFLPKMFMRSTKLSATTKLSAERETPPIANVLLAVCALRATKVDSSRYSVVDESMCNYFF